jgi:hypothetical protein
MNEIKLWKVSGSQDNLSINNVPIVDQTNTEKLLEEILVKAPNLLFDDLKLVARQLETPGGSLDLLGVDEDGQLIVFELKRGMLTRDAVAQIVDYASFLAELSPSALNELVSQGSGKYGIDKINFDEWYKSQFAGKSIASIGKPKMALVGLGADDRSRRMVEFLANGEIEISLITFHGFDSADGTYLAKQVDVVQKQAAQPTKASKQTNIQALLRRIKDAGVEHFYDKAAGLLRSELSNAYEWPNQTGRTYYFQDTTDEGTPSNRAYVSLSVLENPKGSLLLTLQERALSAASKAWEQLAKAWGGRVLKKKGYAEVKIASEEDWMKMESDIRTLCHQILHGRKMLQEQQIAAENERLQQEAGVAEKGTQ